LAHLEIPKRSKPAADFELLRESAAQARLPFDKDVLLNIAFFLDHQYTEWVPDFNSIRTIPRDPKQRNAARPVANKIMHFVMQEHAYALANRPTVDVLPATDDPLDTSIASIALSYLRWLAEPQVGDFDTELSDATMWALIGGEGWLKWVYNEAEGRPDFLSVNPLDIYIDPYCTKVANARYIIHSQFMDVQQIADMYDKEVRPQSLSRQDQSKAALMREMGVSPIIEGAIVNELWLRPGGKKYPKGCFVSWTGDEFLEEVRDFPYDHKRLPFTQLGTIPRPGTPHFNAPVKYLRKPQMELNKYHAQRLMVRQKFSNPKWWVPNELELEQDPDDSPDQVLRGSGSGGLEPTLIQPTTFPENTDGEWIRQEMSDVVGIHEVSQAQVPGRVEAAKAIEMLKESDISRLRVLEQTIKGAISEGYWQALMLAKQYVSEEQIVQTYSREGMPEVKRFKTADLKPGMRVQVTMGTGLSRSRASRQEQAMRMWELGMIQDPEIMSELMEIPIGTLSPQRAYDIRLARNENLVIASGDDTQEDGEPGIAVAPNSWDAHDIHIREHNNFRKTEEYQALDAGIKKKFEFHVQQHEIMELEQLAKEAQKQAALQGAMMPPEAQPGAEEAQGLPGQPDQPTQENPAPEPTEEPDEEIATV
jgi:hypothetical protein